MLYCFFTMSLCWSSNGVKEEAEVQIDDGKEESEDPDTMYQ